MCNLMVSFKFTKDGPLIVAMETKVLEFYTKFIIMRLVYEIRCTPIYRGYAFLPRDALVHSAVLRLHVVRPSVRPSVCPSVCL